MTSLLRCRCRWDTSTLLCSKCPTGSITDPTVTLKGGLALTDCGEGRLLPLQEQCCIRHVV